MNLHSKTRAWQYRGAVLPVIAALYLFFLIFLPQSASAQSTYTWSGGATGDWQVAANWTPARTTTATTDILLFSNTTATVTNVPDETVGELQVTNNSTIALQTTGATLTVGAANGLTIQDACVLTLSGGNPLVIQLPGNNSSLNGSSQLVFANASAVQVTGILKLNGASLIDFEHGSAVLDIAHDAELQINSTEATINFDVTSSVVFGAATAIGQQPSTLRFADAAALSLTGAGNGTLLFGYYYNSGLSMSVQPRIVSGMGGNAATLNITGASKSISLFTNTGGAEGIEIPGDLIFDGGGTAILAPTYANQNFRINGNFSGTNLLTVRNGTTLENQTTLQLSIRTRVEGTFAAPGSVYNSRNMSVYGTGQINITTMNFWSYTSIDLYDDASIRLASSDGIIAGQLHIYDTLGIHSPGAGNTIYGEPALVQATLDFNNGSSLYFEQNAVLNITGATCSLSFISLSAGGRASVNINNSGSATLNLNTSDPVRANGALTYEDRKGMSIDGTLNIVGSAPLEIHESFVLAGASSNSTVHFSTGNTVSVVSGSSNNLIVESLALDVNSDLSVREQGGLFLMPTVGGPTTVALSTSASLTVDGRLNMTPAVGSFGALFTSDSPVVVNGTANISVGDGAFVLNNTTLRINDNPEFTVTSGSVQYNGTAGLEFTGSVGHTASGELVTTAIVSLLINNSGGVTFTTSATITGMLDLTRGLLSITTGTLFIEDVQNASDSSYVVGNLQRYVAMSPTIFPIGDTSAFLPLIIEYVDNGGTVRATVQQGNPTDGRTGMAGSAVPAVWYITAVDPIPSSAHVGFVWPTRVEPPNFSADYAAPARWTGSAWESYRDNVIFRDSGYVEVGSVTEFSPWAVFGGFVTNFVTQPSNITAGSVFSPSVEVEILDPTSATRLIDDNTTQITMSHGGSNTLFLTGATTLTVSNGIATFTGLGMSGSPTSDVYLVASTMYSSVTSAVFTFTGGPAQLGATAIVPSNPQSSEEFEITVEIQTALGEVTSATVTTVVGANFNNPYLYLMGSTDATISPGSTSATLAFALYNSSNATVTTTLTITGGGLTSTTLTIAVAPSCENYSLNFSEDFVTVSDPGVSSLDVVGDISFELWMQHNYRVTGGSQYSQSIAGKGSGSTAGAYSLYYDGVAGDYKFVLLLDGNNLASVSIPQYAVTQGAWTHLAGTFNSTTHEMKLYLNGQQSAVTNVDPTWTRNTTNNEAFEIGRLPENSLYPFAGKVDEVRVWSVERTDSQIHDNIYNRLVVPMSGLAGYWRMDEGTGIAAFDISGNGNHGIINGAVYETPSVALPAISGAVSLCNTMQSVYTAPVLEGASYTWSVTNGIVISGQSTPTATVELTGITTGTISVSIEKLDGCVVSTSMTATYYPPVAVDAGVSTSICFGQDMLLGGTPTASGGSGSFSYLWTPATGLSDTSIANPIAVPSTTTTYTVTITDLTSGCENSSTVTVTVNPVVSSALSLDGDSEYITVPSGVWFNGNYTVEGWVNLREANYWARFIDFGNGPNADNIALILSVDNNGPVAIRHFNGSTYTSQVVTPDNLPLNEWVHLAFVLDGTVGRIYKNGELWAEAGGQSIPSNVVRNNNYIGHPNWSSDPDTKASFDDIRFWNVARTQEQIQQAMNTALTGNEPGLQAYYRLDEGRGVVAVDASANERNATLVGNPSWISRLHIAGKQNICENVSAAYDYSVVAVVNTNYNWSVTGGTITSVTTTGTTSSISVIWNGGVGTVSVEASSTGACLAVSTSQTVIVNQTPVVSAIGTVITDEDTPTIATFTVSDAETAPTSLVITVTSGNIAIVPNESIGLMEESGIVTLTLTPLENQSGEVPVSVTVSDGCIIVSTTFTLTVNAVNDQPVAFNTSVVVIEDGSTSATLQATDVESTVFTYSVAVQGTRGTATINSTTGTFTYTPNLHANGLDSFIYQVNDEDGGGSTATVTVSIEPVNDAPVFSTGSNQIVDEDAGAQTVENWATGISAGAENESDQVLQFTVSNSNTSLFAVQPSVSTSGTLVYTPADNAFGLATVDVILTDNGGTAYGGVTSSSVQSFTITIRPVNDAPVFSTGSNQIVDEDAGAQTVENWATGINAGADNESEQTVTFVVDNNNHGLFSVQPAVSSTGTLTYVPAANQNGMAIVSVYATDNGGILFGGVSTSTVQVFTIAVSAVNDAPVFSTGSNQIVNEDAGSQTVENWATGISAGADNESEQTTTFVVDNNNYGLFSVQPAVSSTGTLTFTPAADAFGVATVDVILTDDGGTAYGGVTSSSVQSFTITIRAVNDAPVFSTGSNQIVNEDAGAQTVENWATGINTGAANESDQVLQFTVSNSNSALFAVQPSVSTSGTLVYTPAANAFGVATVDVILTDNGGTAYGGVTSSTVQSFTITIRPVNDAPLFSTGSNQIVNEDAGAQTVENWATGINTGADNESEQTVTFVVDNNNHGLFSVQPAVSSTGTLTFTPAANAFGVATVDVILTDNGGTAYGGVTSSSVQSFTITIRPVNDAPLFSTGSNQIVDEDAGAQTIANWATGISAGAANESEQTVTFVVDSNNHGLFSVQPAISSTGTLTFTPATDANGSAVVSIYAVDNGGTAYGGVSTSTVQVFTITVNTVNDAPVAHADVDSLCSGSTRTISVLTNDTDTEQHSLSVSAVGQASKGSVSILPGNTELFYVPSGGETFGWDHFTYTVTDSEGASSTATVSVLILPPVEADAGMDTTVCSGSSIRFNGEGVSYIGAIRFEWSPATGVSNPFIADPIVTPSTTTTYTLTVVDGFGCSATDQITVTVVPASATTLSPDTTICAGNSIQLEATGGVSYVWSPSTGLSSTTTSVVTASPSTTTTYTVQIATADGCVVSRLVTVTVVPVVVAHAGSDVTVCVGGSTQLAATGGVSYSWSPSTGLSNPLIANPVASPMTTTTYTVTVSNAGGCSSSASVTVTVNPVVLNVQVLLEGPYNGTSMSTGLDAQGLVPVNQPYNVAPFNYAGTETKTVTSGTAVVDWVLVDLRSGTASSSLVERHAGLLLSDGRIVSGNGSGLSYSSLTPGGSYYVVVWHRNHLSVMSSVSASVNSTCELPYTFMSSPAAAYMQFADGQKQLGTGVYGMAAGDADANGIINAADRVMARNASGATGYRTEDVSLDGIVNAVDRVITRNNTFRVRQIPE